MRNLLFEQRVRRRLVVEVGKVPRLGALLIGGAESSSQQQWVRGRDMSTVRCFACGEMGHYVGQCPKKKKK
jgi:hypothetical protein